MRWIPLAIAVLLLTPLGAHADCPAGIASALQRANALPPTTGRAALLEQIQRAQIAHHEGDEEDCAEQLKVATNVLDSIDAAKKREAAAHDADTKGAAKP